MLAVFFSVITIEALFGGLFFIQYLVMKDYTEFDFEYFNWVIVFLIAILIEIFSSLYLLLSETLTDNENHKTQTDYEDALILKTLIFKIFNHYSALIFTVFFKGPLLDTCQSSCIIDVKQLLYGIFIVRFIKSLYELISPYIKKIKIKKSGNLDPGSASLMNSDDAQILESGKTDGHHFDVPVYFYIFHFYFSFYLSIFYFISFPIFHVLIHFFVDFYFSIFFRA